MKNSRPVDIYWRDNETEALGRNGRMRCIGINIFSDKSVGKVELTPINSKEGDGRSHIQIPKAFIPAVIKALEECYYTEKFFAKEE